MSEHREAPPRSDAFGSAAEEAARLVDALGQWLATRAARPGGVDLDELGAHIATGSEQCRLCPICQLISLVRTRSPELAGHVDEVLEALLALARAAMETYERHRSGRSEGPGLETIDIR